MAPAVGPLLVASAMAMAKLMLVSVVGVLGARYPRDRPVLGKAELQTLSRFAELVLWPAMALWSIGSGVEFGSGAEFGVLCGACAFHCLLSLGLGRLGVRVLRVPPALRNGFLCAAAFNNSAALPMVIFDTLCDLPLFAGVERCLARSYGYIMLYTVLWSFLWFLLGDPLCRDAPANEGREGAGSEAQEAAPAPASVELVVRKPVTNADAVDAGAGAGAEAAAAAAAAAGAPPQAAAAAGTGLHHGAALGLLRTMWGVAARLPMLFTWLGMAISVAGPRVQRAFFVDAAGGGGGGAAGAGATAAVAATTETERVLQKVLQPLGSTAKLIAQPATAVFTLILAASLLPSTALMAKLSAVGGGSWRRGVAKLVPLKTSVGLSAVRLVLVPVVSSLVAYPLLRAGSLGSDPLLVMVILLESAAPSAQMAIVFLSKYGKHDSATKLALSYLLMYPASMLTFTAATTIFLGWTKEFLTW